MNTTVFTFRHSAWLAQAGAPAQVVRDALSVAMAQGVPTPLGNERLGIRLTGRETEWLTEMAMLPQFSSKAAVVRAALAQAMVREGINLIQGLTIKSAQAQNVEQALWLAANYRPPVPPQIDGGEG